MKITDFLMAQFSDYIQKETVFKDRRYLSDAYIPDNVKYREQEIKEISTAMLPLLRNQKASNVLLLGYPGTGKTLSAKFFMKILNNFAVAKGLPVKTVYVNCRMHKAYSSEYYIMRDIVSQLTGKEIKSGVRLNDLYEEFVNFLKKHSESVLIVLDEIDFMVKNIEDDFLYTLTRENHLTGKDNLAFIGIANNLSFLDYLDPRAASSLGAVKIIFNPYNAYQLAGILEDRASKAFVDGAISKSIINYIAGWVAKESGDARKAINILRLAGEFADRDGSKAVTIDHVKEAIDRYELDGFLSLIDSLVLHDKMLLLTIISEFLKERKPVDFTTVYRTYTTLSDSLGYTPLSKENIRRRLKTFKTIFAEYIEIRNISFGRGGFKTIIDLYIDEKKLETAKRLLEKAII